MTHLFRMAGFIEGWPLPVNIWKFQFRRAPEGQALFPFPQSYPSWLLQTGYNIKEITTRYSFTKDDCRMTDHSREFILIENEARFLVLFVHIMSFWIMCHYNLVINISLSHQLVKLLGFPKDNNLNWECHIDKIVKKFPDLYLISDVFWSFPIPRFIWFITMGLFIPCSWRSYASAKFCLIFSRSRIFRASPDFIMYL